MDKSKLVCADCGFSDPTWAIVNWGVVICDECCSVHRSLGRHISQVKSLSKVTWRSSQLNMVIMLNNSSINSLWEHSLNDPKCVRKKPHPKDPVHPVRSDFIRSKYQDLAFVLRSRCSDDQEDLNQQLHSSVRTANLETSLRLLSHGADPNYYHPDKGNYIVHVAAQAGQMEQFELLFCHGAYTNVLDVNKNTPASLARKNGHLEMANKITECMFEVTDRFCNFLCNRTPNHKNGQHFMIPQITECSTVPLFSKQATMKLQQLPNLLFEEFVMDVYDEVDRRVNEAICLACEKNEQTTVPFLPVNPDLSAMRNQGRQKLAIVGKEEFVALIFDILTEARRRQNPPEDIICNLRSALTTDDEPLYDSVASDEDYAIVDIPEANNEDTASSDTTSVETVAILQHENDDQVKLRLASSELRVSELVNQISELQNKMTSLEEENSVLRGRISRYQNCEDTIIDTEPTAEVKQRPTSLYNIAQQYIGSLNNTDRTCPPQTEEVLLRTDQVTKRLQELSAVLRVTESKQRAYMSCSEKIRIAVADLSSIFPQGTTDEPVRSALRSLNTNTIRLQAVCSEIDGTIDKVRKCAFNMAKANRQILTRYQ